MHTIMYPTSIAPSLIPSKSVAFESARGWLEGWDRSRSGSAASSEPFTLTPPAAETLAWRVVPGEFNEIRNSVHLNFLPHPRLSLLSFSLPLLPRRQKFVQAKEESGTRNEIDFS